MYKSGLLNLVCGSGNFGKFCSACGPRETPYKKLRMNKYTNTCNFACVFFYRGANRSLARPGRKQARKHVRDARDFNKIET